MTRNERANFGSKLGVILASAGSAVGLGNIWRFPFETGNHGGAAFILIYLVCVLILTTASSSFSARLERPMSSVPSAAPVMPAPEPVGS